ncbi:amidohydrolase family protein [Streptomyces hypolithicus]
MALELGDHLPAVSGARVAFGTDAGMFPHAEGWREFLTMVENGFTPRAALRAATRDAADLVARPDLGHIAPGATADLVAVPGDPFDDIAVMGGLDFVMQGAESAGTPAESARSRTVGAGQSCPRASAGARLFAQGLSAQGLSAQGLSATAERAPAPPRTAGRGPSWCSAISSAGATRSNHRTTW